MDAKKIDILFVQVYCFRRLSIDFSVLPFFRRGTLRQTVIANYIASAFVESDPQEPFSTVLDSNKWIAAIRQANIVFVCRVLFAKIKHGD